MQKMSFENKIIQGDALTELKKLPDKSIDIGFFDPPYNVGKDYGVSKDDLPESEYDLMIQEIINELRRITKKGFGIYVDWKQFKKYWQFFPDSEPIIIYKRSSGVVYSKLGIVQHHHIILTNIKCLKKNLKSLWDDIRVLGEGYLFHEERFKHPAQTSLKATKRFIEYFSNEGDMIIDPFMGIGTSAIACLELERKFIGIELNESYCKICKKRLKSYLEQTKLEVLLKHGNR